MIHICPVREAARSDPESIAVIDGDRRISFDEFDSLADRRTNGLIAKGILSGDHVGVWSSNSFEVFLSLVALWRVRAICILIPERIPPEGLTSYLSTAGVTRVLTSSQRKSDISAPVLSFDELSSHRKRYSNDYSVEPDQLVTGVFTSGSTGDPKLAIHSLANHYFSALGSRKNIPLVPGNRWLLSLPHFHVSGLSIFFRCVFSRATLVIERSSNSLTENLDRFNITHASIVSTQLGRLLDSPPQNERNLECLLVGGSAIPKKLLAEAHERNWPLFVSYGLTEMSSQVTTTTPNSDLSTITQSSGRVLEHRELRIADDGEILVAGKVLFAGYLVDGDVTLPTDHNGYLRTGDLGSLDSEGNLHVVGRKDNLFISGGENIQPEEIERALRTVPHVHRVCVVPVPDRTFGFVPAAIVDSGNNTIDPNSISHHLEPILPRFKIPKYFLPWPAQSDTGGIKIRRKELLDYAVGLTAIEHS